MLFFSFNLLGQTLLEIKSTWNDTKNVLSNWQDFDESPCAWTGISCHPDDKQRVRSMYVTVFNSDLHLLSIDFFSELNMILCVCLVLFRNLPYMQLGGIISPSIGKLSRLQRL